MIDSDVIRKISNLNNDNRDWQSLEEIVGLIGTILGAIGHKNQAKCATGGLVCSIIGLVLGLLLYIACVACVASAGLL